jgi:hypothetical protein
LVAGHPVFHRPRVYRTDVLASRGPIGCRAKVMSNNQHAHP